jgi:cation transport ATPase
LALPRISILARTYPLPFMALTGLALGALSWVVSGEYGFGTLVWYVTLVIGGVPVVYHTLRGMVKGKFAADIVAMLAIITAILTEEAFAGVIIVLMQTGGEALDDYGFKRASSSLDALIARAPKTAYRRRPDDGGVEEVEAAEVKIGDAVVVRQGDLIPVDGRLASGAAEVDESALTGEPLPRTKHQGAALMSGAVNVGPAFEMVTTKVSTG